MKRTTVRDAVHRGMKRGSTLTNTSPGGPSQLDDYTARHLTRALPTSDEKGSIRINGKALVTEIGLEALLSCPEDYAQSGSEKNAGSNGRKNTSIG